MYEYILSIIGIIIGIFVAILLFILDKKSTKKQIETLNSLDEKADSLRNLIEKITNTKHEYEIPSESISKPTATDYDKNAKKCLELLKDSRWVWRSEIILMRKSDLTQDQFDYFVNNTPEVIRSKKPDDYGNKLFSIKNKL